MAPGQTHATAAWARLQQFQARASDVLQSSIAKRADLATLGTSMTVLLRRNEPDQTRLLREHPPQDELMAAAGLLRPFFLKQEEVHHGKVTNALKLLTRAAPQPYRDHVDRIAKAWQQVPKAMYWSMGLAAGAGEGSAQMLDDRTIADAWLYGHFLHNDPAKRQLIEYVPAADRLLAATLWVKDGVLLTAATQRYIVDLEDSGELRST